MKDLQHSSRVGDALRSDLAHPAGLLTRSRQSKFSSTVHNLRLSWQVCRSSHYHIHHNAIVLTAMWFFFFHISCSVRFSNIRVYHTSEFSNSNSSVKTWRLLSGHRHSSKSCYKLVQMPGLLKMLAILFSSHPWTNYTALNTIIKSTLAFIHNSPTSCAKLRIGQGITNQRVKSTTRKQIVK